MIADGLQHVPDGAVLLVDGDCGFCMRAAGWLAPRTTGLTITRLQQFDVTQYGLNRVAVEKRLHAVAPDGVRVGSAAIAEALRHGSRSMRVAAALLDAPGVCVLAQLGYTVIARFRHRLPGGSADCRLP